MIDEKEGRPTPRATPHNNHGDANFTAPGPRNSMPDPKTILRDYPEYRAWQRQQWVNRERHIRRYAAELDSLCGTVDVVALEVRELLDLSADPYRDSGLILGVAERIAAGRELAVSASLVPAQRSPQDDGGVG